MVCSVAARPLITVVTPTWDRHASLINRCIPSVQAQDYPDIEHIIVSDGPDNALEKLSWTFPPNVGYHWLPEHTPENGRWGTKARLYGIEQARGDYIAYLDDDDELYPGHVTALSELLQQSPEAGFSYSRIMIHEVYGDVVSGWDPPCWGQISTSSIMHRKEILEHGTWRDDGQGTIDWDIVERWMAAGVQWRFYPEVTSCAHRDAPNVQSDRPRRLAE